MYKRLCECIRGMILCSRWMIIALCMQGCQSSSSSNESFSLGAASTETMYIVGDSTVLYYTGGDGGR